MAAYMYVVVQRFYPVKYETGKVLSLLAVDVLTIVIFYFSFGHLSLVYRLILAVVFSAVVIYVSGLYHVKKLLPKSSGKAPDAAVESEIPPGSEI
jgi:hypothetical protein